VHNTTLICTGDSGTGKTTVPKAALQVIVLYMYALAYAVVAFFALYYSRVDCIICAATAEPSRQYASHNNVIL
jgi:hypothetical protein